MIQNSRWVPGVLSDSREYSHNPTQIAQDLYLYVEYIGHAYCSPAYSVIRRKYCHFLLMYIIKGRIVFSTNEQTYEADAGQAFLIETQKPHIYGAIGNTEVLWIHFNGKNFYPFFSHLISNNRNQYVFDLHNNTDFVLKLEDLVNSFSSSKQYSEIIVSAKLYELMGLLVTKNDLSDTDSIDMIVHYINSNYSEPLSLKFLAHKAGLSVSRFSTLFKKETGFSPYNYIINTRLHVSRQYLTSSTYSIEYIATHVGFSDASSYIVAFRQAYKITPHQFRIQLLSGRT